MMVYNSCKHIKRCQTVTKESRLDMVHNILYILLLLRLCLSVYCQGTIAIQQQSKETTTSSTAASTSESTQPPAMPAPAPEAIGDAALGLMPEEEASLYEQYFEDYGVPAYLRKPFVNAIRGDVDARKCLAAYAKERSTEYENLAWAARDAIRSFRDDYTAFSESSFQYNAGYLYYKGTDKCGVDKAKAFAWFSLSADKGDEISAVWAGDMARYGDGVPVDGTAAFNFYNKSAAIKHSGLASERLGDSYLEGIGTVADKQQALQYYLDSACMGYAPGLYKLEAFEDSMDMDLTALYKAISDLDYSGKYVVVVNEGLAACCSDNAKRDRVEKLLAVWDSRTDPCASRLHEATRSNEHFQEGFVNAFLRTIYTYSYREFTEEYGIGLNRNYEDANKIRFAPNNASDPEYSYLQRSVEQYLEYEGCRFYEYDFDGDGIDEIGIPVLSDADGMWIADSFVIFKKNNDGFYEIFFGRYGCPLPYAMQIIKYDDKIYFIPEPLNDGYYDPYGEPINVTAYTIDENGHIHELSIMGKDYDPHRIIIYTDEAYSLDYGLLLSNAEKQMREAINATILRRIYSPEGEDKIIYQPKNGLWSYIDYSGTSDAFPDRDVFFAADVNNDGMDEVIHKGHYVRISHWLDDYSWFQVYNCRDDFENDNVLLHKPDLCEESIGQHSGGNLYDMLPVGNDVVQFWTQEYNGMVYCMTLQRYRLLYVLQIYKVQNNEASLVSKSLFFDEAQDVDVMFHDDMHCNGIF